MREKSSYSRNGKESGDHGQTQCYRGKPCKRTMFSRNKLCQFRCVDLCLRGDEVCHFGEAINNHKDSVECLRLREIDNEIYRYILLWFFRRLKRHDSTKWKVMTWFSNLTLWTGVGEFKNIAFEVVASEVALDV